MKKSLFLLFVIFSVYVFSISQSPAQQNTNLFDDLIDNKRHGLFLGATLGYGVTQSGLSIAVNKFNEDDKFDNSNSRGTSGSIAWRIGYAFSEKTGFYITSPPLSLQPAIGMIRFSNENPDIYFNMLLGYARTAASERIIDVNFDRYVITVPNRLADTWTLNIGIGKEFRRHYAFELTAGFTRTTIPNAYLDTYFRNVYLNDLSLFVSFSYWQY